MSGVPTGRGKSPGSTAGQPRPRPNGFALIEALVALVLISIAALALAAEISLTMASHHMGTEQSRAVSLAVQKIEELKPKPAAQVVDEPQTAIN